VTINGTHPHACGVRYSVQLKRLTAFAQGARSVHDQISVSSGVSTKCWHSSRIADQSSEWINYPHYRYYRRVNAQSKKSIEVGGHRRTFVHVEPTSHSDDAPLLLALHGSTQRGPTMQKFSGRTLDALAERIGANLVYLNGYGRSWNDARKGKTLRAQKANIDDVAFVTAIVERFGRPTIGIGYSNGGQLLHRVLRERHGLLTGAAIIAAGLPVDDNFLLVDVKPDSVPILLVHGTADPVVPYLGGATKNLGRFHGMVQSAADTVRRYAPAGSPVTLRAGDVERTDWNGVRLVSQIGTGHVIPNRTTSPVAFIMGPSHHDLDLGEEIEDFFRLGVAENQHRTHTYGGHAIAKPRAPSNRC
jgi:polyhydroxybutyrate depolymerase